MRQGRIGGLAKYRYRPPAQVEPTVVNVPAGTTFFSHTFGEAEDGLVVLPGTTRKRGISINGGRNVRVVGGEINLTGGNLTESLVRAGTVSGSIAVEGLLLNGGGADVDVLDLGGSSKSPWTFAPDVYILGCRASNVSGTSATTHSDLFQAQTSIRNLYIDKLTGLELQYQGLFLSNEKPMTALHLDRVNLGYKPNEIDPTTYLLWLAAGSQAPVPTRLNEVFIATRSGQSLITSAAWPKAGQVNGSGEAIGMESSDGGLTGHWPARTLIEGHVTAGAPPSGDFVKAADCGIGYVSPGYL
jgi:hypothetical protein